MQIEWPSNLTVYLIRRREYGPLRFVDAPVGPGFCPARHVAAAERCRVTPCATPPSDDRCNPWKPLYFPYDAPLPSGLPEGCDGTPPARPKPVYRVHLLPPVSEQVGRMVDIYV